MERTMKTWGEKKNIFQNDLCEVSVLDLVPNQRCSWHRHQTKFNTFYVIEGELFIKTEWGVAQLLPGQDFTTRPMEWHEFQTSKLPCKVIEVMYTQYDAEDIERETLGGSIEQEA
jgi:mannose-6-phosphate isomerase-like protein (cupin superfamily)